MSKSIVSVYWGGRGSGKTLSMTGEGCIAMIAGKRVWSNYPMHVRWRRANGEIEVYKSIVIDMPDLIEIQQRDEIRDGLVLLDEWNLFCNSRRSGSMSNIIFNGIVQLIRKRKLSFYITTQLFMTLDKNIREQTDITVECYDLAYRYKNLNEGQMIRQRLTDWSGVFTGRPISKWDDWDIRNRNTVDRLFRKAGLFFDCYNTGFEYNVLEAMRSRYSLKRKDIAIDIGDNGGFDSTMVEEYRDYLIYSGIEKISAKDLHAELADRGFTGDYRGEMGKKLKAAGFQYKHNPKGHYYVIGGVK